MTAYDGLTKDQLIERLAAAERQLKELTFSPHFKQNIKNGRHQQPIPMAFLNADGKITYVNSVLCGINGFSEEELVGRELADFVEEDNKEWDREMLEKMVAGECEIFRGEHFFKKKDGSKVCFDVIAIALRDAGGNFIKASYIFNDISISKHNERELSDLLDTQSRIANSLILMMQKETGTYENDVLKIILDRYKADRAYIFKFDWQENTNSNIFEVVAEGISREIDNLQHLKNEDVEAPLSCFREGRPFVLHRMKEYNPGNDISKEILESQDIQSIILFPIMINGGLWGYLGIDMVRKEKIWHPDEIQWLATFTDILSVGLSQKWAQDELARQQEIFDLILNSGSLGYWTLDTHTSYLKCSDNYLALLGYGARENDKSLETLWKLTHPEDLARLQSFVTGVINLSTQERSIEFRIRKKNGEWHWTLSNVIKMEYNPYYRSYKVTGININIDESKKTVLKIREKEDQLAQNEHKYAELFRNMNLGYAHNRFVYDSSGLPVDFVYEDMNLVFARMMGQPKEALIGKRAFEAGHKVSPEVMALFTDVAFNGVSRHHEYYSEQFKGWYSMSIYSPRPGEFITLTNDISARYQAHEIIRRNEQKLRSVFENIPVGIVLYDKNGDYINSNAEILRIFRYASIEELDKTNLMDKLRGRGIEWDRTEVLSFMYRFDMEDPDRIPIREQKESEVSHISFKIVALTGAGGEINGYLLIAVDETEQKRMELSLRQAKEKQEITNSVLSSVLSISHVLPWDCDIPSQTFSCDYSIYHHESQPEPVNGKYYCTVQKYVDSIHPDYRGHMKEVFADLLSGKIKDFHEIYQVHWYNDREYEWVDKQGAVYEYDREGNPKTIIGSSVVITERKRMEQNLINAIEQAQQSNRLKSAFLANMSHEIRTPLNAIVGFSEILTTTEDPLERQEYANIIANNNQLLLQLIGDILDISKIEAGTLEFVYSDVNVNTLLQEVEQASRLKADTSRVKISFADYLPQCIIRSERNRLLQVVNNLITNAIKFTSEGEISFGYRLKDERTLYFYVKDTGCGIPAKDLPGIFGRFVKLNSFVPGTGLGLSICETIVSRLGGRIGVESEEGKGSEFWFTLPYDRAEEPDRGKKEGAARGGLSVRKTKPVILIAEDNESNYKLFESILKKQYELWHAWNGTEAIKIFRERHPDLILMDIKMPELNGIDATRMLREASTQIPILAVTAFAFDADREQALAAGCNDYIAKPVNAKELISVIERYLD